jgi:hypothetical protein
MRTVSGRTIEREMENALARALANTGSWSLIDVVLDRDDRSPALGERAGQGLWLRDDGCTCRWLRRLTGGRSARRLP